jgi:hypothetical protein
MQFDLKIPNGGKSSFKKIMNIQWVIKNAKFYIYSKTVDQSCKKKVIKKKVKKN